MGFVGVWDGRGGSACILAGVDGGYGKGVLVDKEVDRVGASVAGGGERGDMVEELVGRKWWRYRRPPVR